MRGWLAARIGFTLLLIPWALLWGLGATIGTYAWAVTDHGASYRNENLLQMTPLMLALVVLGPTLAFGRGRWARLTVGIGLAGAGLSLLGLILKVLPGFWQHNAEMIALAVPANAGLATALVLLARRAVTATEPVTAEAAEMPTKQRDARPKSRRARKAAAAGRVGMPNTT